MVPIVRPQRSEIKEMLIRLSDWFTSMYIDMIKCMNFIVATLLNLIKTFEKNHLKNKHVNIGVLNEEKLDTHDCVLFSQHLFNVLSCDF